MLNRLLFLFLALVIGTCAHAQDLARTPHPAGATDLPGASTLVRLQALSTPSLPATPTRPQAPLP